MSFRHATTYLSPRDKLDMQPLFEMLALKLASNSEKMRMALLPECLPHKPEALGQIPNNSNPGMLALICNVNT